MRALEQGRQQASRDIVPAALHVLADAASVRGSLDLARERYAEGARTTLHPAHGWILERRLGDSFQWVRAAIYLAALLVQDGQVAEAASLIDQLSALQGLEDELSRGASLPPAEAVALRSGG